MKKQYRIESMSGIALGYANTLEEINKVIRAYIRKQLPNISIFTNKEFKQLKSEVKDTPFHNTWQTEEWMEPFYIVDTVAEEEQKGIDSMFGGFSNDKVFQCK